MSRAARALSLHPSICRFLHCCRILLFLAVLSPCLARAGEWRVTPIRVFFERGARSGIVNVQNDSDSAMTFQVKGMEWAQDPEGKDQYLETKELIIFPKLLTVPPRTERVIRIGVKGGSAAQEKTFRLFIEETPKPVKEEKTEGATVAVNVRFAVPLFVEPVKEQLGGRLAQSELKGGAVLAVVQNTGNVHYRLTGLEVRGRNARGEETFTKKIDGWYLLKGAKRTFSVPVPEAACLQSESMEITGEADRKIILKGNLAVDKQQCKP